MEDRKEERLYIHSIFESISGEAGGFLQGTWCTFVRLSICNLRCVWCDTKDAQTLNGESKTMSITEIVDMVKGYGNKHVLITGGEPLVQYEGTVELLQALINEQFIVQVETNGSIAVPDHVHPVNWVFDYKCPSSEQQHKMLGVTRLVANAYDAQKGGSKVFLKWVIGNSVDLNYALDRIPVIIERNPDILNLVSPLDADGSKIENMVDEIRIRCPEILDKIVFSVQIHKICLMA